MKIFLGTSGIPLSCKKRNTIEGIKRIKKIGLNAMELAFVHNIYVKKDLAEEIGQIAKENQVRLSIHAPFYINLASEKKQVIGASRQRIYDTADRAERMGADTIAIHSAYYGKNDKENVYEIVKNQFLKILDKMKENGINVNLGVETMAKESQFGTLDEVIKLHKEVKMITPYIDWAHLFIRNKGNIDYNEILTKLKKTKIKHINSHFEGVKKNKKGYWVDIHDSIKNPPFEPLVKEILKKKIDITIISESPILEKDSLKMKKYIEKNGYKFNYS